MKKWLFAAALAIGVVGLLVQPHQATAAFNASRLIDDSIFSKTNTMSAQQIDAFLNRFPKSCISTNSGFSALLPTGYSKEKGYQFGGLATAGTIIATAAQAYGINPQVLITKLQKEQSLVTGSAGCDTKRLAAAVGYSCPDNVTLHSYTNVSLYAKNNTIVTTVPSTCVNKAERAGFSQQLIRSAWLLRYSQQRALGHIDWTVKQGNWDNSDDLKKCYKRFMTPGQHRLCPNTPAMDFSGTYTIDKEKVTMQTGATAALYVYTPHIAGNKSFVKTFEQWFGPTTSPNNYAWQVTGQTTYTDQTKSTVHDIATMKPGERAYVVVTVKNLSTYVWDKQSFYPVTLAATNPKDRDSAFRSEGWINGGRATTMQEDRVAPEETATFSFWYQAPKNTGTYQERFNLVAENRAWFRDAGLTLETTVK